MSEEHEAVVDLAVDLVEALLAGTADDNELVGRAQAVHVAMCEAAGRSFDR